MVLCEVCGENEAVNKCEDCGKALCEDCTREAKYEVMDPRYRQRGVSFVGAKSDGMVKKKVCVECLKELDIF